MSFEIRTEVRGADLYIGSFRPNGSSAVSATQNRGSNFSVTRTNTGEFTVVLRNLGGKRVVAAHAHLRLATAGNSFAQCGTVTYSGANASLVITTLTGGSAADIASNADNVISFIVAVA